MNIGLGIGLQFRRPVSGGASYLPLTTAYAASTGITDPTILNACNELEKNIKALPGASINTTYDFYGDGNLAYVYVNRGSSEVGCETDFIGLFNSIMQNAPTFTVDGVVYDGVSDFADTGYNLLTELSSDFLCGYLGYYKNIGSGTYAVGAGIDPNKYNGVPINYGAGRTGFYGSDDAGGTDPADNSTDGVRGGFRISNTQRIIQVRNTQTTINNNFGAHPNLNVYRGCWDYNGNPNSHKAITEVTLCGLKGNMNAVKLAVLKDILNQFVIDLGI